MIIHKSKSENFKQIGKVPWSRNDLKKEIIKFLKIYKNRPIKNNEGGMRSPSLFPIWFLIRKLQPKVIIESGIWKGQGTWLVENAAPKAKLYCIDPNLSRLIYKSKRANYTKVDFAKHDWSQLPKNKTLIIFDDHQNALERVRIAKSAGFKHLIFDDNNAAGLGDTYSLKMVFMRSGYRPQIVSPIKYRKLLYFFVSVKIYLSQMIRGKIITPNDKDANYLNKVLKTYYEFPPIVDPKKVFTSVTSKPLYTYNQKLKIISKESDTYHCICYTKLK